MSSTVGEEIEGMDPQQNPLEQLAVCIRSVKKSYGSGRNKTVVLNGLNMNVAKGSIYGLLGSSACGKTTLLSCIVGTSNIDAGVVWVLGGPPGKDGSGVPGPSIGYMPQELTLLNRFSIPENLRFFGLLCGCDSEFIKSKSKELIELLDLPTDELWAENLSGGQKRRLSLAIALLHGPQLIVLDEPTVGVDPLLRAAIWDHLFKVCSEGGATIIVTTHYIEEARQANRVGLLRGGLLLAEDSPDNLFIRLNCSSLEEVFLKLSQQQLEEIPSVELESVKKTKNETYGHLLDKLEHAEKHAKVSGLWRVFVIFWKLLLDGTRNPSGYFFIFFIPILQTTLFCSTIGYDPKGLHISIVNEEVQHFGSCENFSHYKSVKNFSSAIGECHFEMMSCEFLVELQNHSANYKLKSYDSMEEARTQVKLGKSWGVLRFPANFTNFFLERLDGGMSMSEETLNASDIEVVLDMSNEAIGRFIQITFYSICRDVLKKLANECGFDPRALKLPLKRFPDVYGVKDIDDKGLLHFVVPGILGVVVFFFSSATAGGYIVTDKTEGIAGRSQVCGLQTREAYSAYVLISTVIVLFQCAIILIVVFLVFGLHNNGSWTLTYVLLLLQGISGSTMGLLFATVLGDMNSFTFCCIGYNLFSIFVSGFVWPLEGVHWTIRPFSSATHLALVIQAFRSILFRGWDITKYPVYMGFAVSSGWTVIHVVLMILAIKQKMHTN